MNKWLESSRQFFYMSMAIFFLSSGGFMVRLMFIEDPFHYLGRRLLEQEGKVVIDILSHPQTIKAIRAITTPSKKNDQPLERYIVDRILQKDGAWLRGFAQKLLQDKNLQKIVHAAINNTSSPQPTQKQATYLLGRYAIDRLFQQDGLALQKVIAPLLAPTSSKTNDASQKQQLQHITKTIEQISRYTIDQLLAKDARLLTQVIQKTLQTNNNPTPTNNENARLIASSVERIAKTALQKFFEKDAHLLRTLLKDALQPSPQTARSKSTSQPTSLEKEQIKMAERLGRYTIDQLLEARAQKLRSILLSLVGPELMRMLRESRLTLAQLNQQVQGVPLRQLIQDAAFAAGKGATEGFLGAQSQQKQQSERKQRAVSLLAPNLRESLRRDTPCLIATGEQWLRWQNNALHVTLIRAKDASCQKLTCAQQQQKLYKWLQTKLKSLNIHPNDIHLQLGGCP